MYRDKRILFYIFVFFSCVYLLSASGFNIYNTDVGQARLEMVKSIVDRSDVAIPEGMGIRGNDGREYSLFPVGSVLMALPLYLAERATGLPFLVSMMNQFAGAATALLVFLFCASLGYSKRASLGTACLYGLGTFAWHYAKDPGDHTLETFLVLLSVYSMSRYAGDRRVIAVIVSGASIGFAVITRYTSVLVLPALFLIMLSPHLRRHGGRSGASSLARAFILFAGAALPFVAIGLWYNYLRFGNIIETGYGLMAKRLGVDFFSATPLLTGLKGFLLSPGKGFFYYSPVAILFFFSIARFVRRHPVQGWSFTYLILSYLLLLSRNIYWHGDWAWGPRYIFVLTPFLMIPVAALLDSKRWEKGIGVRIAVYALAGLSLAVQVASVSVHPYRYFYSIQLDKGVKFTSLRGNGVKPIVEPPIDVYFDWRMSPILAQFDSLYRSMERTRNYAYRQAPANASVVQVIRTHPLMNVYDFWWAYGYVVERTSRAVFAAVPLLLLCITSGLRIRRLSSSAE